MLAAAVAVAESAAEPGAAARLEGIAEERHTVAEEEGCGRRFVRRSNRSSCEEGGRLEDVAAGRAELRIGAAVAGPAAAAGLVVAHIAAVVVGPPVVARIVAVVVVGIAAVAAAAGEERGRKE